MIKPVVQCSLFALLAVSGLGIPDIAHGDDPQGSDTGMTEGKASIPLQDVTVDTFRIDNRRPWDVTKWSDFAQSLSTSQLRSLKHGEKITFRCLAAWALLLRHCERRRDFTVTADAGTPIADQGALRQFCGFVEGAIHAELPSWWIRAAETGELYEDGSLRFRVGAVPTAPQDKSVDSHSPYSLAVAAHYTSDGIRFTLGANTLAVVTPDGKRIRSFFDSVHCCWNGKVAALVFFGDSPQIEVMKVDVTTGDIIDTTSFSISPHPGFSGYDRIRASIVCDDDRFIVFSACSDGLSIFSLECESGRKLCPVPYALLWEANGSAE